MKFKNVMLGIGIGILAALFIGFFIEAAYPEPKYEDYCNNNNYDYPKMIGSGVNCTYNYDNAQSRNCSGEKGMSRYQYDANGCAVSETCDYCSRDYDLAREKYTRNLFYITAPIGLIMIILGMYLPVGIDYIAGGILFGGILTLLQVTVRVFGDLGKWPRVILLGVELGIIIWIGIKKTKDEGEKKTEKKKKGK